MRIYRSYGSVTSIYVWHCAPTIPMHVLMNRADKKIISGRGRSKIVNNPYPTRMVIFGRLLAKLIRTDQITAPLPGQERFRNILHKSSRISKSNDTYIWLRWHQDQLTPLCACSPCVGSSTSAEHLCTRPPAFEWKLGRRHTKTMLCCRLPTPKRLVKRAWSRFLASLKIKIDNHHVRIPKLRSWQQVKVKCWQRHSFIERDGRKWSSNPEDSSYAFFPSSCLFWRVYASLRYRE